MKLRCIKYFITGFLLAVFYSPLLVYSQKVKVINETTLQPIRDVYIYNTAQSKMASTNIEGEASLEKFGNDEILTFQHPSYKRVVISMTNIEDRNFVIKLTERSVKLDEIYVSASKREQDQTEIPRKITQISQEEISFSNSQTTADLLDNSGKVFVQKSQLGGGSPMIRGFAANSVLIAVDGIRMNNAIFRSGNLQNVISLDANALGRTEVIYGPGSIIYGSDALGGVMNFQTKDPELTFADKQVYTKTNTMTRYSSANKERTVHADASIGFQKWGFLTSITYSDYDDLRSGGDFFDRYPDFGKRTEFQVFENGVDTAVPNDDVTDQKFSGYEQLNLMQKIRFKPSGKWDLNYGFHLSTTSDIPRYDRLILRENGDTGQFENAEWFYGPQIWLMNSLEVKTFSKSGLFDVMNGVISYQWFQESRNDRKFDDLQLRNREENVNVVTANLDFDKQWSESKELFYGFETVYNYVGSDAGEVNISTGTESPVATRYPDGGSDYTQMAAYMKYRQDLNDNITMVGGARYSHVMLDSRFDSKQFFDFPFDEIEFNTGAVSGSLGFTYRPATNLQFNLNASTGFRAPNVDDVAKVFDSEPGNVVVPNKNLKPEKSYNIDLAVIKRFNGIVRLEVNTFYTWLRDAMVRRESTFNGDTTLSFDGVQSRVQSLVNAGRAYIWGLSAGLSAELSKHLSFESDITFTDGKDSIDDEPLRHVAPLFGKSSLIYKAEKIKIELYSEYNAKKPFNDLSPSERNKPHLYTPDGSPGWATLNSKASYQLNEFIQLNAGMENILDKHYRPYSSGISAPGRNVIVALRATL